MNDTTRLDWMVTHGWVDDDVLIARAERMAGHTGALTLRQAVDALMIVSAGYRHPAGGEKKL